MAKMFLAFFTIQEKDQIVQKIILFQLDKNKKHMKCINYTWWILFSIASISLCDFDAGSEKNSHGPSSDLGIELKQNNDPSKVCS